MAIIAGLLILLYRISAGLVSLVGLGICGLTVSLLKTYIFTQSQRPKLAFWDQRGMIHFVDGIYINIEHSFPSGHALTAFFCFTLLTLLRFGASVFNQCVFAIAAILAAYSRVYLAHHFVGDILAGACTGVVYAFLMYLLYQRIKNKKWINRSVIDYIKNKP